MKMAKTFIIFLLIVAAVILSVENYRLRLKLSNSKTSDAWASYVLLKFATNPKPVSDERKSALLKSMADTVLSAFKFDRNQPGMNALLLQVKEVYEVEKIAPPLELEEAFKSINTKKLDGKMFYDVPGEDDR